MVLWGRKTALCFCQVTHTHTFWQCFVLSLHNMDTHQWPVGELTEQEACVCTREHVLYLSMLAECIIKSASDMQLCVCICAHSSTCVFVKVCPYMSAVRMQPAVCWWLHCMDDTSCWQLARSEDASHNITAGRWEDITSKHTHTHIYTVTHYDTVLKSHQGPYLDWLSSLTSLSILISRTRQPLQAWSCRRPTHKMSHCFISGTVTNAHRL